MDLGFEGKIALVTGAASGIGRATALAFGDEGATLVLLDRDAAGLEALREELAASGTTATAVVTDVSDRAQVDAAHDEAVRVHGRLDIAFNNAGITASTAVTHETSEEVYDRIMAINLKGVWLCLRAQLRHMDAARSGAIVNMASIAGMIAAPGMGPYAAAKHAIIGLTRSASVEYALRGIRVNAVAPGTVETPMFAEFERISNDPEITDAVRDGHAIGRCAQPAEIASAVLWLASQQASFVTGSVLTVDGGFTVQ